MPSSSNQLQWMIELGIVIELVGDTIQQRLEMNKIILFYY